VVADLLIIVSSIAFGHYAYYHLALGKGSVSKELLNEYEIGSIIVAAPFYRT
jgi:hypothetical protein